MARHHLCHLQWILHLLAIPWRLCLMHWAVFSREHAALRWKERRIRVTAGFRVVETKVIFRSAVRVGAALPSPPRWCGMFVFGN